MAEAGRNAVLRRRLAAQRAALAEGSPGADRSWRMALARSARDRLGLVLDVTGLRIKAQSLAEVLELPFEYALIAVLQGPAEGMGLMVLSADVLAALIAEEADLIWAGGFRYASFLDDARPMGLLMEDVGYRLLSAEVSLGIGARKGMIYMVLPAKGRGVSPSYASPALQEEASGAQSFTHDFAAQVEASSCILEAVLAQVSLPLAQVMALDVGAVVPLGRAAIDKLQLMGANGLTLTEGKLGQQRGMRAIRLSLPHAEAGFAAQGPDLDQDLPLQPMFAADPEEEASAYGLPMAQAG